MLCVWCEYMRVYSVCRVNNMGVHSMCSESSVTVCVV